LLIRLKKLFEEFRKSRRERQFKKQYEQELIRQRDLELANVASKLEDPNVSREEAHAAFSAWLDKWLED